MVSLMAGKAEVKYDSEIMNAAAVTQLIEDLGFGAKLIEDNAVTHGKLDLTVSQLRRVSNNIFLKYHKKVTYFNIYLLIDNRNDMCIMCAQH